MSLIDGLAPRRFRSVLVAPRRGPITDWADSAGVPWHELPLDTECGRLTLMAQALTLTRIFRQQRVALVHASAPRVYRAASIAGAITGAKRVCHLQFPSGADEMIWSFRFGIDTVVTCYEEQAREATAALVSLKQPPPTVAIPNPVDIEKFRPTRAEDAGISERWREGASHVVVIVGHLSDVKGYPTFLQAAAQISRVLPGCRFLAVGGETVTAGYGARMLEMARELGLADSVRFLGWRDDVADILRAADVMVLPSLAEGLPLAVLEAMACGRPVVATAVNGTPEAVVDGETGLLIAPNAPAELSESVLRLLLDPELGARMGAAGRRRVETAYTMQRFVSQTERLYEQLLDSSRSAAA
jgi:glycosyltransferase involved in cell wall biosynthesis